MIKNYPVQGFATGDVVPVVLCEIERRLMGMNSCLVNSVHDSVVIDVHPDETEVVVQTIKDMNEDLNSLVEKAYGVVMNVPLLLEAKIGNNWLDMSDV
jgi:DNA polymerase I-like protein with 3'-5' exonuclease and polymerase domains